MLDKKFILGVGITDATKKEILEYILKSLRKEDKKLFIITPNPEFLVFASKDREYKKILNSADLALPDGIGVIIAGKILNNEFKQRITGIGMVEDLCLDIAEKPITVGFLGGRDGVAEKTAKCLGKKYPGLKVGFVGSEWPVGGSVSSIEKLDDRRWKIEDSNLKMEDRRSIYSPTSTFKKLPSTFYHLPSKSIDILFVAFGPPKQEIWISENLDKLPVRVAIGVGGAFDYISGRVPRAPLFLREIGLEWLFRLIVQPWRLKRQLALLEFMWLVLKEKFRSASK